MEIGDFSLGAGLRRDGVYGAACSTSRWRRLGWVVVGAKVGQVGDDTSGMGVAATGGRVGMCTVEE
jgi:hypothetical protein